MKIHAHAPLGPKGRATMVLRVVEQEWSLAEAAEAAGVSERTCSKWVTHCPSRRPRLNRDAPPGPMSAFGAVSPQASL